MATVEGSSHSIHVQDPEVGLTVYTVYKLYRIIQNSLALQAIERRSLYFAH